MDPLSISASIVGLCQVLSWAAAGIRTLASLSKAPQEFLDLQNELNTVRGYLILAQDVLQALAAPDCPMLLPDLANIRNISTNLEKSVQELHFLSQSVLKPTSESDSTSVEVSPVKWATVKSRVIRLRDKIRSQRVALTEALTVLQHSQSLTEAFLILEVRQVSEKQSQDINCRIDDTVVSLRELTSSINEIKSRILAPSTALPGPSMSPGPLDSSAPAPQSDVETLTFADTIHTITRDMNQRDISPRDLQISLNEIQSSLNNLSRRIGAVEESTSIGLTSTSKLLKSIFLKLESKQDESCATLNDEQMETENAVTKYVIQGAPACITNAEGVSSSFSHQQVIDKNGILDINVTVRRRCATTCKCQCHKFKYTRSPSLLSHVVGRFFLAYNTTPVFRRGRCDNPGCRNRSSPSAQLNYLFPTWLVRKALYMSLSCNSLTGTGVTMQLRVPRVIPASHKGWAAIRDSNLAQLQSLLSKKKAFPTDIDKDGTSLLLRAVFRRQWEIADFLVDIDPDVTRKNNVGQSPSSQALFLLNMGVPNRLPEAARPLKKIQSLGNADEYGLTIIHEALLGRCKIGIEQAIELRPNSINAQDVCGFPPLHWAVFKRDLNAVRSLLTWRADTETRDFERRTALHWAAFYGYLDCVAALVKADSIVDARDYYGKTALQIAVREVKPDVVQLLLRHGANVNVRDKEGWTVAHQPVFATLAKEASLEDFQRVYALLRAAGANMNDVRNPDRKTPLMMAKMNGMTRMATAIISNLERM